MVDGIEKLVTVIANAVEYIGTYTLKSRSCTGSGSSISDGGSKKTRDIAVRKPAVKALDS